MLPVHLVASGERFGIDLADEPDQLTVLLESLTAPVLATRVDVAHHAVQVGVRGVVHLAVAELELLEAGGGEGDGLRAQCLPRLRVVLDVDVQEGERLGLASLEHGCGARSNLGLPVGEGHGPLGHGTTSTFLVVGTGVGYTTKVPMCDMLQRVDVFCKTKFVPVRQIDKKRR